MVVPITHTEVVPMTNCGEWYVFVKLNWWNARKCMQEVQYNQLLEERNKESTIIGIGFIVIVVIVIIIGVICSKK